MSEAYHVTRYSRAQFGERLVKELLGLEDTSPSHWCFALGGVGRGWRESRRYNTWSGKARNLWHHQCCYPKIPSDATREVQTLFLVSAGCKHIGHKVPLEKLTQNCVCECPVGICTPKTAVILMLFVEQGHLVKFLLGQELVRSWHSSAVLDGYYRKLYTFLGVIKFCDMHHEAAPWAVAEHGCHPTRRRCCPPVGQVEQPSTGTLQQASWQTRPSQAGSQELRTSHDFFFLCFFFPLCFY